jgi:hypothetical protein
VKLPQIIGSFSYREEAGGKWRFTLTAPLVIRFPSDWWGSYALADNAGKVWAWTDGRDWIIQTGYAWDGSSPKICIGGKYIGTPDFEETRAASCWHDCVGQFRHLPCVRSELPWGRWNKRFAEIIASQGAPGIGKLYYAGLAIGNPAYQLIGRLFGGNKPSGKCLARET